MFIGERIRYLRMLCEDLRGRELDRLAGRSPGHTTLIEDRAGSDVFAAVCLAYARVLGASLDWLIAGDGDAPTRAQVKAAVAKARAKPMPARPGNKKKKKKKPQRKPRQVKSTSSSSASTPAPIADADPPPRSSRIPRDPPQQRRRGAA